jgi:hypothetical protein
MESMKAAVLTAFGGAEVFEFPNHTEASSKSDPSSGKSLCNLDQSH